jgi:hypothetical protein
MGAFWAADVGQPALQADQLASQMAQRLDHLSWSESLALGEPSHDLRMACDPYLGRIAAVAPSPHANTSPGLLRYPHTPLDGDRPQGLGLMPYELGSLARLPGDFPGHELPSQPSD